MMSHSLINNIDWDYHSENDTSLAVAALWAFTGAPEVVVKDDDSYWFNRMVLKELLYKEIVQDWFIARKCNHSRRHFLQVYYDFKQWRFLLLFAHGAPYVHRLFWSLSFHVTFCKTCSADCGGWKTSLCTVVLSRHARTFDCGSAIKHARVVLSFLPPCLSPPGIRSDESVNGGWCTSTSRMEKLSLGMATNDGECNKRHCTKVNNEWKAAERKLSFALSPSQSLHSVKLLVRPCSAYFLIVGLQSGITSISQTRTWKLMDRRRKRLEV